MSCIEKVFCEDDEIKILKKQIEKLKIRWISKEKIFSRLIQKWFSYKDIKNIY
jgi:SOS response regulatory protein OraA/RecX